MAGRTATQSRSSNSKAALIYQLASRGPCAGTSQEAQTNLTASNQETEEIALADNDIPVCMLCMKNNCNDLAFRTTIYNTIHHIDHTPLLSPPDVYSNEDAIEESGLQDGSV